MHWSFIQKHRLTEMNKIMASSNLASFSYMGLVGSKKQLKPSNRAGFTFLIL